MRELLLLPQTRGRPPETARHLQQDEEGMTRLWIVRCQPTRPSSHRNRDHLQVSRAYQPSGLPRFPVFIVS